MSLVYLKNQQEVIEPKHIVMGKSVAGGQGSVQGQMVESHGTLKSHVC